MAKKFDMKQIVNLAGGAAVGVGAEIALDKFVKPMINNDTVFNVAKVAVGAIAPGMLMPKNQLAANAGAALVAFGVKGLAKQFFPNITGISFERGVYGMEEAEMPDVETATR